MDGETIEFLSKGKEDHYKDTEPNEISQPSRLLSPLRFFLGGKIHH